jgi:hypothetical protein
MSDIDGIYRTTDVLEMRAKPGILRILQRIWRNLGAA